MEDLDGLLKEWPVGRAAAGVTDAEGTLATGGEVDWQAPVASVSKLLVGMAALVALEEGAIELDEPAGPPGSTVRHLLAHASGLPFHGDQVLARPGTRRIYSNTGIERFADHLAERTGIAFAVYLRQAVTEPLSMRDTRLEGSPAHGIVSTVADLLRFTRELLRPTLVAPQTLADATRPHFPDLNGVVPDLGRFDPNPWGLAFEVRGDKQPHWTGTRNSPRTFGHFGGSGSFLWVDPDVAGAELQGGRSAPPGGGPGGGIGCVAITDRQFGPWALAAWPPFSDAVLAVAATRG